MTGMNDASDAMKRMRMVFPCPILDCKTLNCNCIFFFFLTEGRGKNRPYKYPYELNVPITVKQDEPNETNPIPSSLKKKKIY